MPTLHPVSQPRGTPAARPGTASVCLLAIVAPVFLPQPHPCVPAWAHAPCEVEGRGSSGPAGKLSLLDPRPALREDSQGARIFRSPSLHAGSP